MNKKGRPADKDEYLSIVMNIMSDSSRLNDLASDLLDNGFSKMTCLELALVACRLGCQTEDLPSKTKAQRDRVEIVKNTFAIYDK